MAVIKLTTAEYEEKVLNSDTPVLLDFWSKTCGPCKTLAPEVQAVSDERSDIRVYSVDIEEEPELLTKLSVMATPTLLVIKDGAVKKKSLGYKTKDHIIEMIDKAIQ